MQRSEPTKSPNATPGETAPSAMRHPPPAAKGVKPRTKSLPPEAMRIPLQPSLPPHALARKPKPPDDVPLLKGSIARKDETVRREGTPHTHIEGTGNYPYKEGPIGESWETPKRKEGSPSRNPNGRAPTTPKPSSSPEDIWQGGTSAAGNPPTSARRGPICRNGG